MAKDLSNDSKSLIDDAAKKQIIEEISNRESLKKEIDEIGKKITIFAVLISEIQGKDEIKSEDIDLALKFLKAEKVIVQESCELIGEKILGEQKKTSYQIKQALLIFGSAWASYWMASFLSEISFRFPFLENIIFPFIMLVGGVVLIITVVVFSPKFRE